MGDRAVEEFAGTDRFIIEEKLGVGAMGVVYRAYDRERGEHVALKALKRLDPMALVRFKTEFRTLADVAHPNLVSLYELLSAGEHWYFTMELIDGVDFFTYVRGREPQRPEGTATDTGWAPPPDASTATGVAAFQTLDTGVGVMAGAVASEVVRLPAVGSAIGGLDAEGLHRLRGALPGLCAGLVALHDGGILHRDVKPSNVLVTSEGRAVVLDFGVVTPLVGGRGVDRAFLAGTPSYMAPEQGIEVALTEAADWYSVGVMLFKTLTGMLPFQGDTQEVMSTKRQCDPLPPRTYADVPDDLDDLCMRLLHRIPQERPRGREVIALVGTEPAAEAPPPQRRSPARDLLIGRAGQLEALQDALAATSAGETRVVFVHGLSGVGKSALLKSFLTRFVSQRYAAVLQGRCYERESVPYKALDALVDELANQLLRLPPQEVAALLPRDMPALTRLFPVLRRIEGVVDLDHSEAARWDDLDQRRIAFGAFERLLASLATRGPTVLYIDDAQWGDRDSAALLASAFRSPAPPVLLIVSYRELDGGSGVFVDTLREELGGTEMHIEPLSHDDALTLAHAQLRAAGVSHRPAEDIARESGGNPYFVAALVRHFVAGRGRDAPLRLEDALLEHVGELSEAARHLLEIVAVAGQPIAQAVALRAAGVERSAIAVLRPEHLIETRGTRDGDQIETYHDRVRVAVLAGLDAARTVDCHLRLARAMLAWSEGDPEAIAEHFEHAGDRDRAAEYVRVAADNAADQLAFARAAALYERAIALGNPRPDELSVLYACVADALTNLGRGYDAAVAHERAAETAPPGRALRHRGLAAKALLSSGYVDQGVESLGRVLAQVGLSMPSSRVSALASLASLRARIAVRGLGFKERDVDQVSVEQLTRVDTCWSAAAALGMSDQLVGAVFQCRHLLEALRTGEPGNVVRALALEAAFRSFDGPRRRPFTDRLLARAVELTDRVRDNGALAWAHGAAVLVEYQYAEWQRALEVADRALVATSGDGNLWWERTTTELYRLWTLFWLGSAGELAERAPRLLEEAQARGDVYLATNASIGLVGAAWLVRDRVEEKHARAKQAIAHWSTRDAWHMQHYWYSLSETHDCLYTADGGAWDRFVEQKRLLKRNMLYRITAMRTEMWFYRGLAAISRAQWLPADAPRMRREAGRSARKLWREGVDPTRAQACLIRAGLAGLSSRPDQAIEWFDRARHYAAASNMAMVAAAADRQRGHLLGGDEGAALIAEAEAFMRAQRVVAPDRFSRLYAPDLIR